MTKQERLEYMKKRFPILREMTDAVIPVGNQDIKEELDLLDSVREAVRDDQTNQELTSDAL